MAKIHHLNHEVNIAEMESIGNYYANVYLNGEFFKAFHFEMYSGNAMMDEMRYYRNYVYTKDEGYRIEW